MQRHAPADAENGFFKDETVPTQPAEPQLAAKKELKYPHYRKSYPFWGSVIAITILGIVAYLAL